MIPLELRHPWIGEVRNIEGLDSPRDSAIFHFDLREPTLSFGGTLTSEVVRFDPTEFMVLLANGDAGCAAGATGTYRWSLSTAGDILKLGPVEDDCPARAAALAGTWTRSDCPIYPDNFCLGPLEPGAHQSTFFNPFVPFDEWEFRRGVMTYNVPAGWTNSRDFPHKFRLQPQDRKGEPGIFMWSEARIVSDERPCTTTSDPDFTPTPDAFVEWLVTHPGLETTDPEPATVGGVEGVVLEAAVRSGAALPCVGFGRYLPMLADDVDLQWGFEPEMRKRLYLLNLGAERTLIISIEAANRDLFDDLMADAGTIIRSIQFHGP